MERLIEEAEELAGQGVKELILVAQETTLYGVDLYGEKSLHKLLQKLCRIHGIRWIRIQYCYPEEIYPELVETMKEQPKICHYLDLPIQHASNRILKRMKPQNNQGRFERDYPGTAQGDPGYLSENDADQRLSGGNAGRP